MSRWQKLRAAVFHTSPGFNPAADAAARAQAAADAYENCADRMGRWADLTVARGGKPDWSEFHAIVDGWRVGAAYLRDEQ